MPSDLVTTASQSPIKIDYNAVLQTLGINPKDPHAQALILTCERYGLDPILKHAVLIEQKLYVTRDGLLHVAHGTGKLDGIEVLEQTETESHHVAKVAVYRKDMKHPFTYVGRFPKMRPKYEWKTVNGKRQKTQVGEELHPYGPEMAVKCSEVMCLRRAFDVSLAAQEEMWDQPNVIEAEPPKPAQVASTVVEASEAAPSPAGSDEEESVQVEAAPQQQANPELSESAPPDPATQPEADSPLSPLQTVEYILDEVFSAKPKKVREAFLRGFLNRVNRETLEDCSEAELNQLVSELEGLQPKKAAS